MRVAWLLLAASVCALSPLKGSPGSEQSKTRFAVSNPEEYVNTLGGTASRYDLSTGNILPIVNRPWGFNGWAPQTDRDRGSWWFHPQSKRFYGIRCTHQPSPWINDWGYFVIAASIPGGKNGADQFSSYSADAPTSVWKPYYFKADMAAYATREAATTIEVTATSHGMIMRVTFPPLDRSSPWDQTRRILLVTPDLGPNDAMHPDRASGTLVGITSANHGGVPSYQGQTRFNFHYYMQIDAPVANVGTSIQGGVHAYFDLDPAVNGTQVVTIRVATSLIDAAQAKLNFDRQVAGRSFDAVMAESKAEWRKTLSRVDIAPAQSYTPKEQNDQLTIFYSSMYRATTFPRQITEFDAQNKPRHYSAYDEQGRVFPGVGTTDSGFWDAYRTVYPQLALLYPTQLGTTIQGWVNAFKEGGWLPKWASPGERNGMVGTMGDVSLADAIVKNISGFDREAAYAAIRQDAFVIPPTSGRARGWGRTGLAPYLQYGYVPVDGQGTEGSIHETVSRTQNYLLADWSIAQAALAMGKTADATELLRRASNYRLLFNPNAGTTSKGFFQGKMRDGTWHQPFDEYAWGGDYTEAGPWQYRFYVPYDPEGLAQLYGGKDKFCAALEAANRGSSAFHIGGYGDVIHEMTEMALLCWGQYEHGNQPVHHLQYMYIGAGCPAQGQYWIRQALLHLHKADAEMFVGDEDNGEMASWYILSALGLYSLAPGSPDYVIGSPLFAKAVVNLESGRTLTIVANNNAPNSPYVAAVRWNGRPLQNLAISYSTLMTGGTLEFDMTSHANKTAVFD